MKDLGNAYKLAHIGIGDDPQVSHMKNLKTGPEVKADAGGVHYNSGISTRLSI